MSRQVTNDYVGIGATRRWTPNYHTH